MEIGPQRRTLKVAQQKTPAEEPKPGNLPNLATFKNNRKLHRKTRQKGLPVITPLKNVNINLKRYSGIIVLLLLAAVVFAPIDVPYTIESVAKALPLQEWVFRKTPAGVISTTLHDHRSGLVKNVEGYQFDRGDLIEVQFNGGWKSGKGVKAGETVASISSNRLDEQLVRLKSQLAVERASREVVASGQKKQLLTQLHEEINLAKEDLRLRKLNLDRAEKLYRDGVVALTDFETAENAFNESMVKVKVAERALEAGASGAKTEALSLAASRIKSLEEEIAFLEDKQGKYVISAPFDGRVRFEATPGGESLVLEDTSATVLLIPVKVRDSRFVKPGQTIVLELLDTEATIEAKVLDLGDRVEVLNFEQVVLVKAIVLKDKDLLTSGMPIRCRIRCGNVRVAEFLKRSVKWQ
jgi:hypothetical protein